MTTETTAPTFAVGSLVRARGREWAVMPESTAEFLVLRPLGGGDDEIAGLHTALEQVESASYPLPDPEVDLADATNAGLLRTALRLGFRSSAGPFRSLASIAVEPRAYQLVPLMMALRQEAVRLLIGDDVGIGKTVEAGLIASELLATGEVQRVCVLCSPALAEQWQGELSSKFGIEAELVLPSTIRRLERDLPLGTSVFEHHPFTVVSTDYIKSDARRHEFLRSCPEFVIVDEAHTAVSDGGPGAGRQRHLRHELLRGIARDHKRHLVLVTATPHSGKDEGFRALLELLDPALENVDLDTPSGREHLARHFVQRRRQDIRSFIASESGFREETRFPEDRETREVPYRLSPAYRALFDEALAFAREETRGGGSEVAQRVRWWSMLALLRALASSPAAAAATLRMRSRAAGAQDAAEADILGRTTVLDMADDEAQEALDVVPGTLTDEDEAQSTGAETRRRRRLRDMAAAADALRGPTQDTKLKTLTKQVKALLADGFSPIVFCRFIDTAEYIGEHLTQALGRNTEVGVVTGSLPPAEREQRIRALSDVGGNRVLVATDCLSEGVNLQDAFQAVVHYDLAWNPTRHEQREGRVDRFGQTAQRVRALTIYGEDNHIDGVVLDVLIRRHRAISKATGVSVPVPSESDSVVNALLEGLLLRGSGADQLQLDLQFTTATEALAREWESSAAREKESRTKFAQRAIHPEEVAAEARRTRAALGSHEEIEPFVIESVRTLGGSVVPREDGVEVTTGTLPAGIRDALPPSHAEPLPFHRQMPVPRRHALLTRTDRAVEAVARFVLDTALDSNAAERPLATRAGVVRTRAVESRTTLLLLRYRFHLDLPTPTGVRQIVAEDADVVAFRGSAADAALLDDEEAMALLTARADANIPSDQAREFAQRAIGAAATLAPVLEERAQARAVELLESHRRVRAGARAARAGLRVRAQLPVDVLGVYVYLPVLGGAS
ncbi:helicase-related protein [Mobilicoccus pelagius]|uniref:Putative helicase n=1 Tax=Mobilicoccus pelagius NBRC 104925 TaxID=1089455 RepID=H5USA1_9MICO|nr:helicase-related protein [Mobilicoccus pelagius]GAB48609.1 putative helicase [Mobilicoccus pelagius NBRC 104925]